MDFQEQRTTEEALRESEERFRSAFEFAPMGMCLTGIDGRFLRVNHALRSLLGYSLDEMLGLNFRRITHPDDLPANVEVVEQLLRGERNAFDLVKRYIRKNGHAVWVSTRTFLLHDSQGRPQHFITHVQDITEQRRAQEERERLEEQLRQAQKMESIGALAGGVAHDFNNLLSPILGYAEMILMDLDPANPLYNDLQQIRNAAERAKNLTGQLLAFGRKQLLAMAVLNPNDLVAELQKILRRLIREDIELEVHLDPSLGCVRADPSQIEQALLNLVANANDAMPTGGRLIIDTANAWLDDEYAKSHVGVRPGPHAMLAVSDTGCGMTAEIQRRIFEPFFTTKGPGKGAGLGLATVYGVVQQHGGHIYVYSEPGCGAAFKIYLPRVDEAPEPQPERKAPLRGFTGTETLLVVEDEDTVRDLVRDILGKHGYRVMEAFTPEAALELGGQTEAPVDLLVTDVIMPGMNGKQLYERLRAVRPDLKVLYISGYSADVIGHHGILDRGIQHLQKPFTVEDLTRKVRETLDAVP